MQHVVVEHRSALSPEQAYSRLRVHADLGPCVGARIRELSTGDPATGRGDVRRLRVGPVTLEETVVAAVPPRLLGYRVTRGGPLRDHRGRIEIEADGPGCRVRWSITFRAVPALLAPVVAAMLRRSLPRGLAGLLGASPPQVTA